MFRSKLKIFFSVSLVVLLSLSSFPTLELKRCRTQTLKFHGNLWISARSYYGFLIDKKQCVVDKKDDIGKIRQAVQDNVQFFIYNRDGEQNNKFVLLSADRKELLKVDKHTTIIVHGFTDKMTAEGDWWNNMLAEWEAKAFPTKNVIAVDWSKLSRCEYNFITDVLISIIGHVIQNQLHNTYGLQYGKVDCVGWSVGAHGCEYREERFLHQVVSTSPTAEHFYHYCFGLDPVAEGFNIIIGYVKVRGSDLPIYRGLNQFSCIRVKILRTDSMLSASNLIGYSTFIRLHIGEPPPNCLFGTGGCAHILSVEIHIVVLMGIVYHNDRAICNANRIEYTGPDPENYVFHGEKEDDKKTTCTYGPHRIIDAPENNNEDNRCTGEFILKTGMCFPFTVQSQEKPSNKKLDIIVQSIRSKYNTAAAVVTPKSKKAKPQKG